MLKVQVSCAPTASSSIRDADPLTPLTEEDGVRVRVKSQLENSLMAEKLTVGRRRTAAKEADGFV